MVFSWVIASSLFGFSAEAQPLKITPQFVVTKILAESRAAKAIDVDFESAKTDYFLNFSLYDLVLSGSGNYEDSRALTLSGGGNLRDRTSIYNLSLEKRLPTGTTVGLGFTRTLQNSTFRPSSTSNRGSYAVYDVGGITITQDLLGNFFGIAERKNNQAARDLLEAAIWKKKESQEKLVLDSLKLFWDTYVAKESFRESLAQREKYEALLKEVQKKARVGFASPGDLPKAKAEYQAQVRNVKAASYQYLHQLEKLLTALRIIADSGDVVFEVSDTLPSMPTMVSPSVDELREVRYQKTVFDGAELARRATSIATSWPDLKLVGEAGSTGLEANGSKAFSSMSRADRARYSIGLEVGYRFFSDGNSAKINRTVVDAERSWNNYHLARENLKQVISSSQENVKYTYGAAVSTRDELADWESAVRAQERSYQQGRLDFSQLMQDYNRYFQARSNRIRALGNYHIALHDWAAAVDRLVE